MSGQTIQIEEARRARTERTYRDALRAVNDIARRAIRGEGETRFNALASIDRVSAKALREGN